MEQRAPLGRRRKVIRGGRRTEGRLSPLPSQPVPQHRAPAPGLDRRPQSGERAVAAGGGRRGAALGPAALWGAPAASCPLSVLLLVAPRPRGSSPADNYPSLQSAELA